MNKLYGACRGCCPPLCSLKRQGVDSFLSRARHARALLALLLWMTAFSQGMAYNFEKDGVYYDIINGHEVAVSTNNKAVGKVVIPETVTHNEITYEVTELKAHAFYNNPELISVT